MVALVTALMLGASTWPTYTLLACYWRKTAHRMRRCMSCCPLMTEPTSMTGWRSRPRLANATSWPPSCSTASARLNALGYHGEHHLGAVASGLSPEAWLEQELLPSIETFAARNLTADVMAMPRGDSTSEHETAILEVVERVRLTSGPPRGDVTPWSSGCGAGPVHAAVSLDEHRGGVERWLPGCVKRSVHDGQSFCSRLSRTHSRAVGLGSGTMPCPDQP